MNTAWILPTLAISLAAAGVALLAWSLFWDRARGRKRCPKCWYDMAGAAGLVCPECGRDAKRERGLLRTRRRWRWAGLALTLILAAAALPVVQPVRERGWVAAVPTIVLVRLVPMPAVADMNDEHRLLTSTQWAELERRRRDMHVRHERVLMRRLFEAYSADTSAFLLTRGEWAAGEPVWAQINPQWWMQGPTDRELILAPAGWDEHQVVRRIQPRRSSTRWATTGWLRSLDLISPPPSDGAVELDVILRERLWDYDSSQPYIRNVVWRSRVSIPVKIAPDADQIVTPIECAGITSIVHQQMTASLLVDHNREHAIVYSRGNIQSALPLLQAHTDAVLALHVEVERDGELVATGALGAMNMEMIWRRLAPPIQGVTDMYYLDQVSDRLFAPGVSDSVWTVRVRGDAATALRCFDAKRYWKGEAELPLTDLRVWHKRERGKEPVEEHIEFPIEARR